MGKRELYRDNFEDVYIRTDYMKRAKNMDDKYIKQFAGVIHTTAKIMYEKTKPTFDKVGFDYMDIVFIANLYTLYYMSLYSIENVEKERKKFDKYFENKNGKGKKPKAYDIEKADRSRLIKFLRDKLSHCSVVCARKARNIIGGTDRKGYFAFTDKSESASDEMIISDYKKYGYRKVTVNEFKEARKKAKELGSSTIFDKNGYEIKFIQIFSTPISVDDYYTISYEESTNRNPEDIMISIESEKFLEKAKNNFNKMDEQDKKEVLKKFINNNKGDSSLKTELQLARKLLGNKEIMV